MLSLPWLALAAPLFSPLGTLITVPSIYLPAIAESILGWVKYLGYQANTIMSRHASAAPPEKKAIAANYVAVIADVIERRGGDKHELLKKAGIKASHPNLLSHFITLKQYQTLLREGIRMTGDPALGLHIGQSMKFGSHGTFIYASLSFPTAWDAFKAGLKFSALCDRITTIDMHAQGAFNVIRIETPYFSGALYQTVIEIVIGTFCEICELKFNQGITSIEIDLRYGRPEYGDRYDQLLKPAIRFEQQANEIRIPKRLAETKLAMADATVAARFEKECDEMLASMSREEPTDIAERVRQALFISKGGFPSLEDLAERLSVSSRTLRRRLRDSGTSFQQILEDVRLEIAKRYLLSTHRSIGEIADMLGYQDQNSFSYSFRKLTGVPPTIYRKENQRNHTQNPSQI